MILINHAFIQKEIFEVRWYTNFLTLGMILHHIGTAFYIYSMIYMYVHMASSNMHSVEDTTISEIYQKAKYHNIPYNKHLYYYSKKTKWENLVSIMGS